MFSSILFFSILIALSGVARATTTTSNNVAATTVAPGTSDLKILQYTVQDGGDVAVTEVTGDVSAGDSLTEFDDTDDVYTTSTDTTADTSSDSVWQETDASNAQVYNEHPQLVGGSGASPNINAYDPQLQASFDDTSPSTTVTLDNIDGDDSTQGIAQRTQSKLGIESTSNSPSAGQIVTIDGSNYIIESITGSGETATATFIGENQKNPTTLTGKIGNVQDDTSTGTLAGYVYGDGQTIRSDGTLKLQIDTGNRGTLPLDLTASTAEDINAGDVVVTDDDLSNDANREVFIANEGKTNDASPGSINLVGEVGLTATNDDSVVPLGQDGSFMSLGTQVGTNSDTEVAGSQTTDNDNTLELEVERSANGNAPDLSGLSKGDLLVVDNGGSDLSAGVEAYLKVLESNPGTQGKIKVAADEDLSLSDGSGIYTVSIQGDVSGAQSGDYKVDGDQSVRDGAVDIGNDVSAGDVVEVGAGGPYAVVDGRSTLDGSLVTELEVLGQTSQTFNDDAVISTVNLGTTASNPTINLDDFDLDSGSQIASALQDALPANAQSVTYDPTGYSTDQYKIDSSTDNAPRVDDATGGTNIADSLNLDSESDNNILSRSPADTAIIDNGLTDDDTQADHQLTSSDDLKFWDQDTDSSNQGNSEWNTGEDLVKDADDNGVFQDEVTQIDLSNQASNPIGDSEVDDFDVYTDTNNNGFSGDDEISGSSLNTLGTIDITNEAITQDTTFYITMDVKSGLSQNYNMQAKSDLTTAGSESLSVTNTNTQTVDAEGPTITSATTSSTTTVDVTISDTESDVNVSTIDSGDFTVGGEPVTGISGFSSNSGSVSGTLTVASGDSFATGDTPNVEIVSGISDTLGNSRTSQTFASTADGVKPVVSSATAEDTTSSGHIDKITLTLSEGLTKNTPSTSAFTVKDSNSSTLSVTDVAAGDGATTSSFSSSSDTVVLELGDSTGTTGQPTVTYTAGETTVVKDDASSPNELADGTSPTVTDSASPRIRDIEVTSPEKVQASFSEQVDGATGSTADLVAGDFEYSGSQTVTSVAETDLTSTATLTLDNAVRNINLGSATVDVVASSVYDAADNAAPEGQDVVVNDDNPDDVAPVVNNALTVDQDDDGQIDHYKIDFNEAVDDSTASISSAWSVASRSNLALNTSSPLDSTDNDDVIYISFDESGSPDTGDTPSVTATSPTIEDSSGNQLRDVGVNDVTETDSAQPVITDATTYDVDDDGDVGAATLTASEDIDSNIGGTPSDYEIGGSDADSINAQEYTDDSGATSSDDADKFRIELSDGNEIDGTEAKQINYDGSSTTDGNGNNLVALDNTALTETDGAKPVTETVETLDADDDGDVETANIIMSEAVDDDTITPADFDIGSNAADSSSTNTVDDTGSNQDTDADDDRFSVSITDSSEEVSGTAAVDVTTTTESLEDANANTMEPLKSGLSENDLAAPLLTAASIDNADSTNSLTKLDLEFSEDITTPGSSDLTTNQSDVALRNTARESDNSIVSADVEDTSNNDKVLQTGDNPGVTSVPSVTDGNGNNAALQGSAVEINTFRKQLNNGWNYVSFPIADETTEDIEDVLDTSNVDVVWKYSTDGWESYDPDQSDSQNDFDEVEGGQGYLVNTTSQHTIAPNVNNVVGASGPLTSSPAQFEAQEGFNLLGQYQEFNQDADIDNSGGALNSFSDVKSVYRQTNAGLAGISDVSTSPSKAMKTGEAFWVDIPGDLSDGTVAYTEN